MIIQDTRNILERHLGKTAVETIDNQIGIFRCIKTYEGSPYKILYVDCSNKWQEEDFETKQLETYLEKYLLKDYYSKPGSLQWNFYYAFVSPPANIKKSEAKKEFIEADELYSRKYVWSPAELDQWLDRVDNLSHTVSTEIERDLSSIWMSELKKQNLDIIYSAKSLEDGVRLYMSGQKPSNSSGNGDNRKPIETGKIALIRKLNIKKFRDCYKNKTFDLGKVNLLTGINGSGKTSLMEAIELLLCGQVYRTRNLTSSSTGSDIEATVDGMIKPLKLSEGSLKLYKQRDREWYNNPEQLLNRLDMGFSKYNFYNTDAAYELANKKDGKSIKQAFEDIALGDGVNSLEADMNKFMDRFKKDGRAYKKQVDELHKEEGDEKKLIKQLSNDNQNPAQFLTAILKDAEKVKWVLAEAHTIVAFKKNLVAAAVMIQAVIQDIKWSGVESRAELIAISEKYAKALEEIKKIDQVIRETEKAEGKNAESLELETEKEELLDQLVPYYKIKRIAELPGLSDRIKQALREVKVLQALQILYDDISAEDVKSFKQGINLADLEIDLNKSQRSAEKIIKDLSNRQQTFMEALNQLDRVVKEIKSKGLEFVKLNPTATDCPLCNTEYNTRDLTIRIRKSKDSIRSSSQIDTLDQEIKNKKAELKKTFAQKKSVEKLKKVFDVMYDLSEYERTPIFIWNAAGKRIILLDKQKAIYDDLKKLEDSFASLDLDEDSYVDLVSELEEIGLKVKNGEGLSSFIEKTKDEIKRLQKEATDLKKKITQVNEKRNSLLADLQLTSRSADQVMKRSVLLIGAEKNCQKLLEFKTFRPNQKFSEIKSEIEAFKKMLDEYELLAQRKAENDLRLKSSNKKLEDLQSKKASILVLQERADSACKAIEKLLSQHNKQTYLEHFIEVNKKEILEIFRMIHTPSEFIDLGFDGRGDIVLTRQNKTTSTLSEISTGQRSALSLSVFSALNRKLKNGPNLLMFDDPVANVDDLNVLSYFDYLREVAARGDRQIFFATANENLAFLFSQKFAFLGDQFVTIPMGISRSASNV